jgi:arsenate reductase-like glutaredoxin family protein
VDAKKVRLGPEQSLRLVKEVDEVYVAKGARVVHLDLKRDKPDRATLLGLLLGPSGNLRAPTLRKGRTLLVGFDESTYKNVLR